MRPVCLVGAQCRRRRGLARIGLRVVASAAAAWGSWRNLDGPVGGRSSIPLGLLRLVGIARSGGIFGHGSAESAAFRGHASRIIVPTHDNACLSRIGRRSDDRKDYQYGTEFYI